MGKSFTPVLLHSRNRRASRATSGRTLFVEGGDGRSAWALRWKDLILAHVADLGGPELLSEAQISFVRRAAVVECEAEAMEACRSKGQKIDRELYARLTSLLCRMLDLLGIRGLTKPLDPMSELAKAMEAYPAVPVDDDEDDEPLPIEEGLDREPGEA